MISLTFVRNYNSSPGTWVGQQSSGPLITGLNSSLYLHFLTLLIRWKILIPPLCKKIFITKNFLKQKGSSTKYFGTVTQKSATENCDTTPSFTHKIFRYQKYSGTQKGPLFSVLSDKVFDGKSSYPSFIYRKL